MPVRDQGIPTKDIRRGSTNERAVRHPFEAAGHLRGDQQAAGAGGAGGADDEEVQATDQHVRALRGRLLQAGARGQGAPGYAESHFGAREERTRARAGPVRVAGEPQWVPRAR